MGEFSYVAVRDDGRIVRGRLRADTERDAEAALSVGRLHVVEIRPRRETPWKSWAALDIRLSRRLAPHQIAIWCRQFATLIAAGVPVTEGIRIAARESEDKGFRAVQERIAARLEGGERLGQAILEAKAWFPPMVLRLIPAGEQSGTLDATLDRLASYFESEYHNLEKVKTAVAYPLVVGIASIAVTVFVMTHIVPTFVSAYASYGATLPWATRGVMALSSAVTHFGWAMVLAIAVVFGVDRLVARRSGGYRLRRAQIGLRLPILGIFRQKQMMAQMTRTLGLLLESGMVVTESIDVVRQVLANDALDPVLQSARAELEAGHRLSRSLLESRYVPDLVAEMIAIGEETGNLEDMLAKAADLYDTEVSSMAERMQVLLEPVMIMVLAGVVGIIVLAVLAPDFQLLKVLH